MRMNARTSAPVAQRSKFGRVALAVGGNLREVDRIVVNLPADETFAPLIEALQDGLARAENAA